MAYELVTRSVLPGQFVIVAAWPGESSIQSWVNGRCGCLSFWCGLCAELRRTEVYAVCRLCRGYGYAAVVRHIAGLGNAGMLIACPGCFGVRGSRDATAKTQETVCGIGSPHQCSGARGRLLRLVGAISGITRVRSAFDLVWHHGGAKETSALENFPEGGLGVIPSGSLSHAYF
jgi:hypothetical protein